jgi:hypothetical protein
MSSASLSCSLARASSTLTVLALAVATVACSRTLNLDSVKTAISEGLTSQLGLPIASVTCPAEAPAVKAGNVFECTATPKDGGRFTVKVSQKDDQGNIAWEVVKTEGLLDLAKVEAAVQKGLKDQAQVDATVSCGGRWKAGKAGDRFECAAKAATGQDATVVVDVTDNEGNINWAVK